MSNLHKAYERIWLQVDPDGEGPLDWDVADGATWCSEQLNDTDVEYVRADKFIAELQEQFDLQAPAGIVVQQMKKIAAQQKRIEQLKSTIKDMIQEIEKADSYLSKGDRSKALEGVRVAAVAASLAGSVVNRKDDLFALREHDESRSDCHGPDWTERDGEYLK